MSFAGGRTSTFTHNRRKKDLQIQAIHEKTFRAWVNGVLSKEGITVTNLGEDFRDGTLMIRLLEVLSGDLCAYKWHKTPEKDIHKMENVAMAIEFAKRYMTFGATSKDIVNGNLKIILGFVWRVILKFRVMEVHSTIDDKEKKTSATTVRGARAHLLNWCKEKTKGYKGVSIDDFDLSWYDGLAFAALLHSVYPDMIDFESLNPKNAKENLELVFETAEEKLDIPSLLDADDICSSDPLDRPDEQCFMTYISEFPIAFAQIAADIAAEQKKRNEEDSAAKLKAEEEARLEAIKKRHEEEEKVRALKAIEDEEQKRIAVAEAERLKIETQLATEKMRLAHLRAQEAELRAQQEEAKRATIEMQQKRRQEELRLKEEAEGIIKKAEAEVELKKEIETAEDNRIVKEEEEEKALRKKAENEELERLKRENERLRKELEGSKTKLIGKFNVKLVEARGLVKGITSMPDTYCLLYLERQTERTPIIKSSVTPKWDMNFEFYVSDPDAQLTIELYKVARLRSDEFLGRVIIEVLELINNKSIQMWHTLHAKTAKKAKKTKGELLLELCLRKT